MTKGVKKMATADLTRDYRVSGITEFGADHVSINFQQASESPGATTPGYAPGPNGNIALVLSRDDARGIFPGDTYTVSFTKNS